jgi:hypothetical protein
MENYRNKSVKITHKGSGTYRSEVPFIFEAIRSLIVEPIRRSARRQDRTFEVIRVRTDRSIYGTWISV